MPKEIISKIRNSETGYSPFFRLLPNLVTLTSLCIALTAILHALNGDFEKSVMFLLISGFMDGVDGRLARFLNSSSDFGAQLDSLVDFANFSIAPGFILYFWLYYNDNIYPFSWAIVLFFAVCGAIRLARFNVDLTAEKPNPILEKYFFKGIPAPVGAAMATLPIVIFYGFGASIYNEGVVVISYVATLAVLMASRVPTISIKKIPIKNDYIYLTLIVLVVIIIGLIIQPWITLALIAIVYIFSIPLTIIAYIKIELSNQNE